MKTLDPPTSVPVHPWLRSLRVCLVPASPTPLLADFGDRLTEAFRAAGHVVQARPDDTTDIMIGTAPFGEPISWRQSLLFAGRARFGLGRQPAVWTLIHATPSALQDHLARLERALTVDPPTREAYDFPGLAARAHEVLHEQGRRGGPILALERMLQGQAKTIRIVLVVGDDRPDYAYLMDLVGAHPRVRATDPTAFYGEIVLRLATIVSTDEAVHHEVVPDPVPEAVWASLSTPAAMARASEELGHRNVFTSPVRTGDLVSIPSLTETVASQYSEGCFSTWEPALGGLVVTITGSARPLDKGKVTERDLAVVVGIRPDGSGARARPIEGRRFEPPSSEAVEMLEIDAAQARVHLPPGWNVTTDVPLLRSKVHAHRGVRAYNRERVEFVALEPAYYHYLVSCASEAQAHAVARAFGRSESLADLDDPRRVAFTVLPGHGLVIVERWIEGRAPFETIWEMLDRGDIELASRVPQGRLWYEPARGARMELRIDEDA